MTTTNTRGPVTMRHTETWADGFGRWHASVPTDRGSEAAERRMAQRLIRAELAARGEIGPGYRVRVARELVTLHGTSHYAEAWTA